MATLLLTAVGTALGGPVGGMIGSLAGQAVDARWLTPGRRRGPRLSDLRVQTSSYGSVIPRLYGQMRVAGTVIWATDLVEHRHRRAAGKGQPRVTSYSYTASFAVALSSRPIVGIGRIWADGNLLRGRDGSFVEPMQWRLHHGDEDQQADPLIVAAEGIDQAPAYRGIAYLLFEDCDLTPFGNRIPSLTCEVIADPMPATLEAVAADLCPALASSGTATTVAGYAVAAGSRGDALAPLADMLALARGRDGGWRTGADRAAAVPAPPVAAASMPVVIERAYGAADRLPRAMTLAHYDVARDFLVGTQATTLAGGRAAALAIDLPLADGAEGARRLLLREAARLRARQQSVEWPAGLAGLAIAPGDVVAIGGRPMLVTTRRIEGGNARLTLTGIAADQAGSPAADGGRAVTSPDLPSGDTVAALFDLPAMASNDGATARLVLMAAGTGAGWRRAAVALVPAAGAATEPVGTVAAAAALGSVVAVAGTGTALLIDDRSMIEVALASSAMTLANADHSDLLAGANLAAAGDELLQFGEAAPLGNGRWRLTRLLRGRFGTEDAMTATTGGAPFALIDVSALPLAVSELPAPAAGGEVLIGPTGTAAPLTLPIMTVGRAMRPLAPVFRGGQWGDDGSLLLRWTRRSRSGFDWRDHVDAPLDAQTEAYVVTLSSPAGEVSVETTQPEYRLSPADIAALSGGGGAASVTVAIRQRGDFALSAAGGGTVLLG